MSNQDKPKRRGKKKPLSAFPHPFEDVMREVLQVPPPREREEANETARVKRQRARKGRETSE